MGVLRVLFSFKFVLSPQDTETKVITTDLWKRKSGAARAELSLLELCRVVTDFDNVKIRSSKSRVRSASPLATNGTQEARLHYTES